MNKLVFSVVPCSKYIFIDTKKLYHTFCRIGKGISGRIHIIDFFEQRLHHLLTFVRTACVQHIGKSMELKLGSGIIDNKSRKKVKNAILYARIMRIQLLVRINTFKFLSSNLF